MAPGNNASGDPSTMRRSGVSWHPRLSLDCDDAAGRAPPNVGPERRWCHPPGSYLTAMSFSAHKRDALDATVPLNHRMSHLRSCAMLMGQKHRVPRSVIIERVLQRCGVDITLSSSDAGIQRAVQALVHIKEFGLDDPAAPSAG